MIDKHVLRPRLTFITFSCLALLFWVTFSIKRATCTITCPSACKCDDSILKAVCGKANLAALPMTLNPKLKELYMSENRVSSMKNVFFYSQLEILSISSNRLLTLSGPSMGNLSHLQILFVDRNLVSRIAPPFYGLESLIVLNLADNRLRSVSPLSFVGLTRLEELDLSGNSINQIGESAFVGLDNLKVLSLRNNELTRLPSDGQVCGIGMTLLKLDVGLNHFSEVSLDHLNCLSKLAELRMDQSSISKLSVPSAWKVRRRRTLLATSPSSAFPFTKQTTTSEQGGQENLNFFPPLSSQSPSGPSGASTNASASSLFDLDTSTLPLFALKALDLSYNEITSISIEDDLFFRHLTCFTLKGNHLNCDCSLKWLKDFLLEKVVQGKEEEDEVQEGEGKREKEKGHKEQRINSSLRPSAFLPFTECRESLDHLLQSVTCLSHPVNRSLGQVDLESTCHSGDFSIGELEKSYVFIWLMLLAGSSIATLILVCLKYSLFRPRFPRYVLGYDENGSGNVDDDDDDVLPFVEREDGLEVQVQVRDESPKRTFPFSSFHPSSPSYKKDHQQQQQQQPHHQPVRSQRHSRPLCPLIAGHFNNNGQGVNDSPEKTQMLVVSTRSAARTTLLSHTRATDEMV